MIIKKIRQREYRAVLAAVYDSFDTFDADSFTERGCASFKGYASFDNFAYRQRHNHVTFVAKASAAGKAGRQIAGMIEIRGLSHISMLFVPSKYVKTGVGRALMEYAIGYMRNGNKNLHRITVNASPYAHGFYRHMGFLDTEPAVETDGMIYTPMALSFPTFFEHFQAEKNALL